MTVSGADGKIPGDTTFLFISLPLFLSSLYTIVYTHEHGSPLHIAILFVTLDARMTS
jgi:hypothetical protein